jgi:hypothetical protein
MIRQFGSQIAQRELGVHWADRFVAKHHIAFISAYARGIDRSRAIADNVNKYDEYFNLMESQLAKYNIEAGNSYNMDEKGFMLGVVHKSKRVFSRHQYEQGEMKQIIQDGNHNWITVMACICADGTAIPPGLIYESSSGNIQDSWVRSMAKEDDVYVACSNSGWSNNNLALAWLRDVFDPATKAKAGRSWRLLIADGHGSHVTMEFIDYCIRNRFCWLYTHLTAPIRCSHSM